MASCDSCGKDDAKSRCSNCKSYYYCDINCSKVHWGNGHRAECKMITDNLKGSVVTINICQCLFINS